MDLPSPPPPTRLDSVLLELSWTLFGMTCVILCLRFYSDFAIMHTFRSPSWLALLAILSALASQVLITYSVHWGLGRHIGSLNFGEVEKTMTYIWQAQPLQLIANAAGKVSIATLLVTLHGPRHAKIKSIFIWTLAGIQVLACILGIAFIYAQCRPVAKLWRPKLPGTCDGQTRNQQFAYVQGAISSSVDLALAIYPIVLFWDLQIPLAKKMILSVLFAFGTVACASGIVRTVKIGRLGQTHDFPHAVADLVIWNTVEMYLVITAGSLPGLRPIFNKRARTASKRSSYGYQSRHSRLAHKSGIVLKLSNLPSGRAKAYASSSSNKRTKDGSTENFFNSMSHGDIMKTTQVDVESGKNSVHGEPHSKEDGGPRESAASNYEVSRVSG